MVSQICPVTLLAERPIRALPPAKSQRAPQTRATLSLRFAAWQLAQTHAPKPIELPPEVPRSFVRDVRAFHAERDGIKRDEIAAPQSHILRQYQRQHEKPIKLHQVKEMFHAMKDHA